MKKETWIRKSIGKRLLSLLMVLAMVITMVQLPRAEKVLAADGQVNIKIHFLKDVNWTTPALQYWGGSDTTAVGDGEPQQVEGWDVGAMGIKLIGEGNSWYSISLKGDFEGFQFLDMNDPTKNSGGKGYVLAMKYCTDETPRDLYCKGSSPEEWYLDKECATSINTLIPEDVEEEIVPATWTGDFTGITFKSLGDGISNWTPADEDGDLNYVGSGVYAKTFCFDALAEEVTIQYKVAFNHGWSDSIGDGGNNVTLDIPAGATAITIVCDKENRKLYSGIAKQAGEADKVVSLIGTIRGHDDWKADYSGTEFDFTKFSENIYVYQMNVLQGNFEYKIIKNPGAEWLGGGNKSLDITAASGKLVTFVYDDEKRALYDSVNDLDKVNEILASKVNVEPIADSVKVNKNGTITFTAEAEGAQKVELVYGEKSKVQADANAVKKVTLSPISSNPNGYTTGEMYLGDTALDLVYYYIVDGTPKAITDGGVEIGGKSYLEYQKTEFTGRTITVPGTLVDNGGTKTWDPSINTMSYIGNGLYEFTFHNVAPANYEYKIATGAWTENYGKGGVKDGANIAVTVPKEQDVTVWYSDFSHFSKCSLNYTFGASLKLEGTGISSNTIFFNDSRLTGVYSAVVPKMQAGTYSDTTIVMADNSTVAFAAYEVKNEKDVTFYYDPESGVYYSNASDATVDTTKLMFDSKNIAMKAPFGAVETGKDITYTIETGSEVTDVRLIVKGAAKKNIQMTKKAGAAEGKQLWTATTSFDKLGEYKYFFAVYNGTAAVMYGDDEKADYGKGEATDLLNLLPYDQIIYQAGYKTPDWMKNAVIYQIFPERFYDADVTNNQITTDARGNIKYEYMRDWYILPENPEQETEDRIDTYPTFAYKGDGNWSNEIYGGDLKGITQRIDYLKALGVTVIYLNPVFESISSHRYDTSDYKNIDPILGTLGDFEELVSVAEKNGMHIVLDGVFNHVSDDSVYFDRYYEYLEAGTDTLGAYPYWAYVYDYMAENNADQQTAEAAAKKYFTDNYGIKNFDYVEWFDVFKKPLTDDKDNPICDSYGLRAGKPVYGYDGWWGYDSMPIIKATNGSEYQTGTWARDIIGTNETSTTADDSVTQYWLSKGMDGWRLDVANEVSDETWQHFRKSVKALDSDNVIIGEIWTDAIQYLMGDMYDSVMNYMFRGAVIDFVKAGDSAKAMTTLERLKERYPQEAFYAMMNLVDSHDTTRILSYLDGIDDDRNQKDVDSAFPTYEKTSDEAKLKQYLVALMQFTYAGAPTVYYGDELGMVGGDDPDDRRAMIWGKGNKELVEWYAKLAAIRSNYTALRTGSVEPIYDVNGATDPTSKNILAYVRRDDSNAVLVMMNNNKDAIASTVDLSSLNISAEEMTDLITGKRFSVSNGKVAVDVPGYNGLILVASDKAVVAEINTAALKPGYDPAYIVPYRKESGNSGSSGGGSFGGGGSNPSTGKDDTTTPTTPDDTTTPTTPDNTTVTTNPDGTTTETKTETTKNDAGNEVTVTITTEKDADGNVTGSKEVSVIAEVAKNTSATVTVKKDADGKITSAKATVSVEGTKGKTNVTGTISGGVVSQIVDSADTKSVRISVKVKAGDKSYTVKADADELTAGAKLKVVAIDSKTKKYVLVNAKTYTVSKDGDVKVSLPTGKTYELVTGKEASTIEKQILNTVKVKKSSATVKKGKNATVQMSSKLDMKNVSKITYTSSKKSVATVSKNGKVTAKKEGSATVKAKVTLMNGKTKTVSMKIKVK